MKSLRFSVFPILRQKPNQICRKSCREKQSSIFFVNFLMNHLKRFRKMFQVGLSSSKNICFICFNDSPLKMMKMLYFILKALLILKIFKFLSPLFGHVGKTLD